MQIWRNYSYAFVMLKKDVLAYYGSQSAVARALGISHVAVSKWPQVVPEGSAYKLESLTERKLVVDRSLYEKNTPASAA